MSRTCDKKLLEIWDWSIFLIFWIINFMSLYIVNVFWIVSDKSLSFHFFIVKNFNQEISYLTSFIKLSLFYANNVQIQKFFI